MATREGKFVWYDLMTNDMKSAAAFYSGVIGWKIADSAMPGMEYSIITARDTQVGGVMPIPPGAPGQMPFWNAYIGVPDVDAYAKDAVKLGGIIHREPTDIPGVGRFAVVADPHGATFLLFKGNTGETPKQVPMGTPGHVAWRELRCENLDAAWTFYSKLFGWTKGDAHDMGSMGLYQTFKTGGDPVGGMMKRGEGFPPPSWRLYFGVDSVDKTLARAKAAGGKVDMEPMQVPGGTWVAVANDPQGAQFGILSNPR
jgi:uncharacterized protein